MLAPGMEPKWDDNTPLMQQMMLAFNAIRQQEEWEELEFLAKCLGASSAQI